MRVLSLTIRPGDTLIDYAYRTAIQAGRLQRMMDYGIETTAGTFIDPPVGIIRYFKAGRFVNPIEVTRDEIALVHSFGLGFIGNQEQGAGDALQGYPKGFENGRIAAESAHDVDYPEQFMMVCSYDTGITVYTKGLALAYGRGFNQAAQWPGPKTVYGGTYVGNRLAEVGLCDDIWKANASSWSPLNESWDRVILNQLRQTDSHLVDPNVCLRPFEAWWPHDVPDPVPVPPPPIVVTPPAPTPPPAQEDDMTVGIFVPAPDAGFNAQWIGPSTSAGVATMLEWTGSGDDQKVRERMAALRAAPGVKEFPITFGGLSVCTLIGPLPGPGQDAGHEWTGQEFFRTVG